MMSPNFGVADRYAVRSATISWSTCKVGAIAPEGTMKVLKILFQRRNRTTQIGKQTRAKLATTAKVTLRRLRANAGGESETVPGCTQAFYASFDPSTPYDRMTLRGRSGRSVLD